MNKTIEQLQQEYADNEVKIQQEKHKLQRLNNRVQYYEKGDRQKRAHRLITGCTVNFKTFSNSIWDKKQRENPVEKQAVFHDTHERIIADDVFDKGTNHPSAAPPYDTHRQKQHLFWLGLLFRLWLEDVLRLVQQLQNGSGLF